jgi:hypothetical protein
MHHRGIEYTVTRTKRRDIWRWHFWINDRVRSGQVRTTLEVLANRRVQLLIDRELKKTPAARLTERPDPSSTQG